MTRATSRQRSARATRREDRDLTNEPYPAEDPAEPDWDETESPGWYALTDVQFSVVAQMTPEGRIAERVVYDPYGRARQHHPTDYDGDGDATIAYTPLPPKLHGPPDPVNQCDFHMIGRNPNTDACWKSKQDRRNEFDCITDPEQSLEDAYPKGTSNRETVKRCFCCKKADTGLK